MAKRQTKPIPLARLLDGMSADELRERILREAPKDERLEIRLSAAEKELLQRLAQQCGVNVSALLTALAKVADERLRRREAARLQP
jgi:hypothetical protein